MLPLLTAAPRASRDSPSDAAEHEVAVMLVDFRWRHSQRRLLPDDLLCALNRFSETVGSITRAAGGLPIQFMGDRVTVLFGLEVVPLEANRQALLAAVELDARLAALHAQLQRELGCETRHVVHLHTGRAAVGETGDQLTRTLTAAVSVIDVVWQLAANTAQHAAQRQDESDDGCIVVSRPVWVAAQRDLQTVAWHELELTGGTRIEIARLDSASVTSTARPAPARQ